jgi:adenine/guanine phosphoribosyltransferase-like PRPP-binding protein
MSLTDGAGQLHYILRMYKRSPRRQVRQLHAASVIALLARFLRDHESCIADFAGGTWDIITTVPSTATTGTAHALETAFSMYAPLDEQHRALLHRGTGNLGHNLASDTGYVASEDVRDVRVLVVDDTFTSGARSQSAVSALQLAGATVVAIVPIGRYINPGFSDRAREYWNKQRHTGFDFDTCCLE